MPHLSKIVNFINDHLKDNALKGKSFQGGKFYGLAKKVMVTGMDTRNSVPSIVTSDGYGIEATPDDTFPFSIYHRCLNGQFFKGDPKTEFGSDVGVGEANQMLAIVYADPAKVETTQEDLAFIIGMGLPHLRFTVTNSDETKKAFVSITPLGFNNDSKQVFTGEYEAEYALQPQSIYFSLSYKIEITADRDCVNCP